jgi:hypothetical protein
MTICASGEISLGGSTTGRSVNLELGRSATAAICMNEAAVRCLAAKNSGAISMSDFYNRTRPPTTIGQVYEGGYYTGVINIGSNVCYYMIIAPNATGCAVCAWKTTNTTSFSDSTVNGFLNTYAALANASHPAGNFTATRTIGGYTDWYLGSITEAFVFHFYKDSMPAGQGYGPFGYWSSTEATATNACLIYFPGGELITGPKSGTVVARALRRVRES